MKKHKLFSIFIVLILLMALSTTAFAQDVSGEAAPACEGESVTGTVVAVDEESGLITVELEDGSECTVEGNSASYDQPITDLLGYYFSDGNPDLLGLALETTTVCATDNGDGTYSLPAAEESTDDGEEDGGEDGSTDGGEEDTCDGVELTVTGEGDEFGTFTAEDADGNEFTLTVEDEDTAGDLSSALNDLQADWALDEDGNLDDVGDDIDAYHDDGTGYGVLVKLYAIAAESEESCQTVDDGGEEGSTEGGETTTEGSETTTEGGEESACEPVTVEELMAMMAEGDSLADLFDRYGRPSMMGVGHVRQALYGTGDGDGGNGVCNARSKGGNANATGQDITCPSDGGGDDGGDSDGGGKGKNKDK